MEEHNRGEGASFTRKNLSVELIYLEEFDRIDAAFLREKQIQRWSRKKKEALIDRRINDLKKEAECKNESHSHNKETTEESVENRT
jgi:putative endonuclease